MLFLIIADSSLADVTWLLSLLWYYSHQDGQSLDYFQQTSWLENCKYMLEHVFPIGLLTAIEENNAVMSNVELCF